MSKRQLEAEKRDQLLIEEREKRAAASQAIAIEAPEEPIASEEVFGTDAAAPVSEDPVSQDAAE